MEHKNVWVYIELNDENIIENVSLELLNKAYDIAKAFNEKLVAIVIGHKLDEVIETLKEYGVDEVIIADDKIYENYNTEIYKTALSSLCEKYLPNTMLIGATNIGRDLAPRVAAYLKAGLTADCTELEVEIETKNVLWSRPTFGGNLMATIIAPKTRPQIGTVRPSVFGIKKHTKNNDVIIIKENISIDESNIKTRIVKKIPVINSDKVNLKDANIIIGVGLGIGNAKNFELVEKLAKLLNASIACTRAIVDLGYKNHSYQVGQSGKTVSPDVYIAIGISGAMQHTSGMINSKTIIAINKDPYANIFNIADYGIVGDLFEIIPKLIDELENQGVEN